MCAATYETLIGLLAATGMRISEGIKPARVRRGEAELSGAQPWLLRGHGMNRFADRLQAADVLTDL